MYILRQIIFALAFCLGLEKKKHYKISGCISVLLLLVLAIGSQWVLAMGPSYEGVPLAVAISMLITIVWCSITFIVIAFAMRRVFAISALEAVYAVSMSYICEHIDYCVIMLLAKGNPSDTYTIFDNIWLELVRLGLVSCMIYFLFAKRIIHEKHYITQTIETTALLVSVLLLVEILSGFATNLNFVRIHAIYAAIMGVFFLVTQLERQKSLSLQKEMNIREQLLVLQQLQYESYKENIELVNRKCHDLKHQVEAIKQIDSKEEKNKALSEIQEAVLIYDSFIKTGCEMLDTILTQKNHICIENDILFTCVADGRELSFMNAVDLYTLFGNLMDNAIEAVMKLPKEKRSISLFIGLDRGLIVINEENTYDQIVRADHHFLSTKPDKENHGYGLRSMELVIEKYDGCINSMNDEDKFQVSIVIPQE